MRVHWFPRSGATDGFNVMPHSSSQYTDMLRNYTFYTITGISINIIPKIYSPEVQTNPNLRAIEVATNPSTTVLAAAQGPIGDEIRNAKDYKLYGPHDGSIQRYYKVNNYLKGVKEEFVKYDTFLTDDKLMATDIYFSGNALGAVNAFAGKVKICYYFVFKNRRHSV